MVKKLVKAGSIDKFLSSVLHVEPNDDDYIKVSRKLIRLRFKHDFPFWAATLVYIHNKKAGKDVLFHWRGKAKGTELKSIERHAAPLQQLTL